MNRKDLLLKKNEHHRSVFGIILPEIRRQKNILNLRNEETNSLIISFPTTFFLLSNKNHCILDISVLGFGIYLSIRSYEEI